MPPDEGEGDEGETEANGAGACLKELEADAEGDHEPWKRRCSRQRIGQMVIFREGGDGDSKVKYEM